MNTLSAIFKARLKGGALYIAIIAGIVIGIILIFFILLAKYNLRTVTTLSMNVQLAQNLKNGIEIAKSDYFSETQNGHWIKNTFNDDSISISRKGWGAFLLVTVRTKNRRHSMAYSGLYGTTLGADTGLLVADNSRPVGFSGNIILKANCYLPKAGIKPAYIEGQSYNGASQNSAFIKASPGDIPEANEAFRNSVRMQLGTSRTYDDDSIISNFPLSLMHPFSAKTIVLNPGRTLAHVSLKGNIKIMSYELLVDSSAHLEDVLIVCGKIKFGKGFRGTVHVVAKDSITAGEDCRFSYPSSFVLAAENDESSLKCVQFGNDCIFSGAVIALNVMSGGGKVFVKLNGKSEVNGFIYSHDYMHVEGKLNASVICSKLLLKTPSAVYENHLLGCEIDPKKYAGIIGAPVIFKRAGNVVCCKAL
jgi:hypothetical protein